MPILNILTAGTSINDAFTRVTNMDPATIATASSTEIFLFINSGFTGTFTITGIGLTTATIGGVEYINGGTVTGIIVSELGTNRYEFTDLALSGAALGAAMVADREGSDPAALESLFATLTYTINGRTVSDAHDPATSFEGFPINLTANNTYNLGDGADTVTAAGIGNDTIHGGNGADSLLGNGGNDSINGDGDNDSLYGGNGNDTLYGGADIDSLYGGDNDDVLGLFGSGGRAEGGEGNDYVSGVGSTTLYGDGGNDTLLGDSADTLYGGSGNDSLLGVSPISLLLIMHGDGGNDTLNGTFGADDLYGGADDDVINGLGGSDAIYGGDGNDLITTVAGIAQGDAGNDTISAAGPQGAVLFGDGGNDVLIGSNDEDGLYGGNDNDTLFGGGGADNLDGGNGNDQLAGGTGGDTLNGGIGTRDLAVYDEANHGDLLINLENVTLNTGAAAGDSYIGIEGVIGGQGDDTITGDTGDNYLAGGFGYDSVYGGDGNDTLLGGGDDDGLFGGNGDDRIVHIASLSTYDGGIGNDTLEIQGVTFASDAVIDLAAGSLTAAGFFLSWAGFENYVQTTTGASSEQVYGTAGDNLLDFSSLGIGSGIFADGRQGIDTIYGSAGNDTLNGGGSNDVVYGGGGDDLFVSAGGGGLAGETLFGGSGNDIFQMDNLVFTGNIRGGDGDRDLIDASPLTFGVVFDLLAGTYTDTGQTFDATDIEDANGGTGNDTITGSLAANRLSGGGGNDVVSGGGGNDTLAGGEGNDVLVGGAGADILDCGAGTRDRVQYTDSTVGLRADIQVTTFNTGIAAGDTFFGVEDIYGSFHGDSLLGDASNNIIWGDVGNDIFLDGRIGNDTIYGGSGNDVLIGGWGADVLDGGSGMRDRVQYTDSTVGLRVDIQVTTFNTGIAVGDVFVGIEDIYGSFNGDTLLGDAANNIIWGEAGSDAWLDGRIGNDTVYGGAGNDVLIGGSGADSLDGGAGIRDRVQYTDSTVGLRVDIQVTTFNTGVAVGDTYVGIEDVFGSFQGDTLLGNAVGNIIWGAAGNDVIDGRDGADTLIGGAGNDTLIGGTGADVILFETALGATNFDSITGYSVADDTIQLENAIFTALTATGALAGTAFISGTAATTAAHRIIYNSTNGQLLYDADGNAGGAAVHFATLSTGLAIVASEFVVV